MISDELLSLFRREMADTAEPYLWSNDDVYTYIDDAQKMFCRLTDGISDASTRVVTEIVVSVGATWLNLHPRILKVRSINRASDGRSVDLVNHEDLDNRGIRLIAGRSGPVRLVITGMEENKLRLDAAASVEETLQLLVFRLPLNDIDNEGQGLEIPVQHHMHLLPWVKRCALLKQDSETFDRTKAEEMESIFRAYCAQAKREQEMKRHKGARTVAYGGLGVATDISQYGGRRRNW